MNIDYHYGVIYAVARLAGLDQKDAQIVAHACQYVDDASTPGILEFVDGESFERFASAHDLFDYVNNSRNKENRVVWAPFHFLPGGEGKTLEERVVCKPNSKIAQEMIAKAIDENASENGLHRLGVSLHVYVDTWAHQGFSGIVSETNKISSLTGDDYSHENWFEKLKTKLASEFVDVVSGLGHGAALHFPDMPWAKWQYTNGNGEIIERDNLPDFIEAADMACKAIQGFIAGDRNYQTEQGLPAASKESLRGLLGSIQDHDEKKRLQMLSEAVKQGVLFGVQEEVPPYLAKGQGSWKHEATGIVEVDDGVEPPKWSQKFEDSNYRKFHDAIKEHRFVVTQKILPRHGLRLA